MTDVTVRQFAEVVGIPVDRLLSQMTEAGLPAEDADRAITDNEKMQLLDYLRTSRGTVKTDTASEPKKITLRKKTVSELKATGSQRKGKIVSVEVRKKRTYVKGGTPDEQSSIQEEPIEIQELDKSSVLEVTSEQRADVVEASQNASELLATEAQETVVADHKTDHKTEHKKSVEVTQDQAANAAVAVPLDTEGSRHGHKKAKESPRGTSEESEGSEESKSHKDKKNKKVVRKKSGPGEVEGDVRMHVQKGLQEREETRYGRAELHVADDKSGRRSKKPKSRSAGATVSQTHAFERPTAPAVHNVMVPETISVAELAQRMSVKSAEVIKALFKLGVMATINQSIDQETATIVIEEMGHKPVQQKESAMETNIQVLEMEQTGEKFPRPPVITVMGHVDHGKTSLLDYIRKTKVVSGEAGGITQHIGAYRVQTAHGELTFIDTPGHAAFTAMRARGAKVTDIVVLVVAADDGVMPQTIEAIQHAKAAKVPLVVAINKMDKPSADPDRVKTELSKYEVISEDWGGDTIIVPLSAHTGDGVDDLLESLVLQAEVLELKAVVDGFAKGVVLESSLDRGRGPVATILVQEGTLELGQMLLSGSEYGRVRAMFDEAGNPVDKVGPSTPVVVLGLSSTPNAGDDAFVVTDERKAREIAEYRETQKRDYKLQHQQASKLQDVFSRIADQKLAFINLLIKADVQGSAEALTEVLRGLSNDEMKVNVISSGVGGFNESDVQLALASGATLIGFNVRADSATRQLMAKESIDVRYYSVIYDAIDDVKKALAGLLGPEIREQIIGLAEVRDVFRSSKLGAIAGCLVVDGTVRRSSPIRILRNHVVIFEGELESLRRFKDDVKDVQSGVECGIGVKNYNDIKPGDQIEVYERIEIARVL